jgi:HD-like signal output (HDOD) protein
METNPEPAEAASRDPYEELLPHCTDTGKEALRQVLVDTLNSHDEVLPAAENPLRKLWSLVNSPDSTLAACEEIILLDPALTARIFRVANSAAYGANASTVSEAIRFVGFKTVRQFVFSAGVFDRFSGLGVPDGWDLFWLRNIFVARLTERMVGLFRPTDGTEYLAGLTHDMGWLFLAAYAPEEFGRIWNSKGRISEAEREVLPFSHANLGAAIAMKSAFPPRVVDSILHHHRQTLLNPSTGSPAQNARLVEIVLGVADKLADASQLDLFARSAITIPAIEKSPEGVWLKSHAKVDFDRIVADDLKKAQDLFDAFFSPGS